MGSVASELSQSRHVVACPPEKDWFPKPQEGRTYESLSTKKSARSLPKLWERDL